MRTDNELAALQAEIERVVSETARLLLEPGYGEEELGRLDARARELRQRLQSAAVRDPAMPRKHVTVVRGSGGLVSGG